MSYLVDLGNNKDTNDIVKNLLEKRGFKNKSKNWRDVNIKLLTEEWNIAITSVNYIKKDNKRYYIWKIPRIKNKVKDIIRIINHYPNPDCITNKANLTRNLKESVFSSNEFYKESHIINLSKQKVNIESYMEKLLKIIDENLEEGVWITKPSDLYEGKNIKVHKDKETLKQYFKNINLEKENEEEYIIQKYVENPMLYDGRKFDIRVHVLLDKDFNIYIHDFLFVKLSSNKYDNDYNNQITQITNYNIQKNTNSKLPIILFLDDVITKKDLLTGLKDQFCYIINQILPSLKEKLLEGKNNNFENYYELLGFDFVIEENEFDAKVFLLEINQNPGLITRNTEEIKLNYEKMLDDTFSVNIDPIFKNKKVYKNNGWKKIFDGKLNIALN